MSIASKMTYVYFVLLVTLGMLIHTFQKVAHRYNLVDYVQAPPKRPKKKSSNNSSFVTYS
jgi:hypothetical protein